MEKLLIHKPRNHGLTAFRTALAASSLICDPLDISFGFLGLGPSIRDLIEIAERDVQRAVRITRGWKHYARYERHKTRRAMPKRVWNGHCLVKVSDKLADDHGVSRYWVKKFIDSHHRVPTRQELVDARRIYPRQRSY